MAAGRTRVCSVGFSVALWFLVFYAQLIILKSMEKDIAFARRPVASPWRGKVFKPWIYQPSAMSGNHCLKPTHHRKFYSSSSFITGLFLLCGDIISHLGPTTTKRTQLEGSSVPLKCPVINGRSMKS